MIKLNGIHKYFNKGKQNELHVINDISLELPDKGMVAIFGKSGCGKTTLLNVIGGLDKFASGSVSLDGADVTRDTDTIRNKYVGYIFQNYNLNKEVSCFDNVADALRLCGMRDDSEIEKRVMAALANVGMESYAKRPPDTLSGGQQQRIAIARAIVKNPKIILADEPTGNLDDSNTIMIMDLLKEISGDHLVVLVTHEAELVDYYCDTVIELSDGKVANIKKNETTFGYTAKDKNHIYLGELEKRESESKDTVISFYGNAPEKPISLTLVNDGERLYLKINTEKVQLLDEFSEIKLMDGVYEQRARKSKGESHIDMSSLPPLEGERFGRLFGIKSSIKSGYSANFKKKKKGKRILRRCMCLFAAVTVLMSAVFGTSIGQLIDAKNAYHHNVFYLFTPSQKTSDSILEAVGSAESGIDGVRLLSSNADPRDVNVRFNLGYFESFEGGYYSNQFGTHAVFLDSTLAKDLALLEGKRDGLREQDILITSTVADALIENSPFEYINDYSDLIGLTTSNYSVNSRPLVIAGVLDSKEPSIYLEPLAMARSVLQYSSLSIIPDTDYTEKITSGETIFINRGKASADSRIPKLGETISVRGISLKVSRIIELSRDYESWLSKNGIKKVSLREYINKLVAQSTSYKQGSAEFQKEYEKLYQKHYFDYLDEYYSELDSFLRETYILQSDSFELWLYFEKNVKEIKYLYVNEPLYYSAVMYKQNYGQYPPLKVIEKDHKASKEVYEKLDALEEDYNLHDEFKMQMRNTSYSYVLSESDYIAISKRVGDTHPSVMSGYIVYDDYYYGDGYSDGIVYEKETVAKPVQTMNLASSVEISDMLISSDSAYTVIHSTDPEKTAIWLESNFGDLDTGVKYRPAIVTPDSLFDQIIEENREIIISGLVTMSVILAILSVCMYFIMRSSLMNRIKEIGIYRAIGVSKKNLIFRFLIESAVLMALTVFIGYLVTSAFIFACIGLSAMVSELFFYPWWMALAVLSVLLLICLFCGTLPIMLLLKKTPSEILAKYDI